MIVKKPPIAKCNVWEVSCFSDLEKQEAAWNTLLASTSASPVLSYAWMRAFFELKLGEGERWLCLFATKDEQLVGVFPLIEGHARSLFGFRLLPFRTPHNVFHTTRVDALIAPEFESVMKDFLEYLSHSRKSFPVIRYRDVPADSPCFLSTNTLPQHLSIISKVSTQENIISLPAHYSAYESSLQAKFRRELHRRSRKLNERIGVAYRLRERTRSPEKNLAEFLEVENSGWKGTQHSSGMKLPNDPEFYLAAVNRLQPTGFLEWNFLEAEGKTIAAHLNLHAGRSLYVLKIAYREDFSFCAPGSLLLAKVIENSMMLGDVDEINFMADCPWHQDWQVKSRSLHQVVLLPRLPWISAPLATLLRRYYL